MIEVQAGGNLANVDLVHYAVSQDRVSRVAAFID